MAQAEADRWPVEPLLASSLIGDDAVADIVNAVVDGELKLKSSRAKDALEVGISSIDTVLNGGIEDGALVGVSGEGADLCLILLASFLLTNSTATAAIIDTTGNLDVFRIYTLILARLKCSSPTFPIAQAEDVAAKLLDRVKIMRVFDFVGISEAISEVRDGLEMGQETDRPGQAARGDKYEPEQETDEVIESDTVSDERQRKKTVIPDSEDEDEAEDEDEMLLDAEYNEKPPSPLVAITSATQQGDMPVHPNAQVNKAQDRTRFILIDNLAHVVSPLLKKDYIQTNALVSSFLSSLASITHKYHIRTLLSNPCMSPRVPNSRSNPPINSGNVPQLAPPPPLSIFSSNTEVPMLGGVLSPHLDLHMLVSKMPRSRRDALLCYGKDGQKSKAEMVSVVEVVNDRHGERTGGWSAFVVTEHGIREVNREM